MMDFWQGIVLGGIQGVTEFLPISSSAHLVLVPYIFGWDYRGLGFDVALHFGTVIAILIYFWRDFWNIILGIFGKNDPKDDLPAKFFWMIVLATIPAGVAGYFLSDIVEENLHNPYLLAANLAVFGVLLLVVDRFAGKNKKISEMGYGGSFLVGLFQAIALIPGVSRSGITMIGSRSLGLSREAAARFAFIIGAPAMIGAFLFEAVKTDMLSTGGGFWVAVLFTAITGFFAIDFLLKYLKRGNFAVFAYYRIALAILVVVLSLIR